MGSNVTMMVPADIPSVELFVLFINDVTYLLLLLRIAYWPQAHCDPWTDSPHDIKFWALIQYKDVVLPV